MPPLTTTKQAMDSANSCSMWLLLMHSHRPLPRMMPPAPLLNHCKIPPPSLLPLWQKSSIECTSSSPTTASCPSSPPATATQTECKKNSEIALFLCHHLMQLCHFFARRLLIFLFPWWPNLPTEISQPPGKILTDQCLPPLWPPKCQQTLWKSGEIVQFFIQLHHFSSCHLQNFMLLPWPNRNRNILAPDKITTGQCPLLSDHPLPKRTVKKVVRLCILMHFHNYNFATYKFPSWRNGWIHQQGYNVPQAKKWGRRLPPLWPS